MVGVLLFGFLSVVGYKKSLSLGVADRLVIDLPFPGDRVDGLAAFVLTLPLKPPLLHGFGVAWIFLLHPASQGEIGGANVQLTPHLLGQLLGDSGIAFELTLKFKHHGLKVVHRGLEAVDSLRQERDGRLLDQLA